MSSTCRSCGAPVIWAHTETGSRMPVDPERVQGGNVMLIADVTDDGRMTPNQIAKVVKPGDGVYVSHFATCPDASQHRRSR